MMGVSAAPKSVSSASPKWCSSISGLYGKWGASFFPPAPVLGECRGEVGLWFSGTKPGVVPIRISLGRVAGRCSTREECAVWSRGIPMCSCNSGPHRSGLVVELGRRGGIQVGQGRAGGCQTGASTRILDKVVGGDSGRFPSEFCPEAAGGVREGGAWPVLLLCSCSPGVRLEDPSTVSRAWVGVGEEEGSIEPADESIGLVEGEVVVGRRGDLVRSMQSAASGCW